MEELMHRHIVPDVVKNQVLFFLTSDATVYDAVKLMAEQRIGAILIAQAGKLEGIFTERDVVTRVVSRNLDPKTTRLKDVMTANPDTVAPSDTALAALEQMGRKGYRHLPVMEDNAIVGMVSVRDLFASIKDELEQDVRQRDQLIFDTGYGTG
jgi:CBS domain-containing protein